MTPHQTQTGRKSPPRVGQELVRTPLIFMQRYNTCLSSRGTLRLRLRGVRSLTRVRSKVAMDACSPAQHAAPVHSGRAGPPLDFTFKFICAMEGAESSFAIRVCTKRVMVAAIRPSDRPQRPCFALWSLAMACDMERQRQYFSYGVPWPRQVPCRGGRDSDCNRDRAAEASLVMPRVLSNHDGSFPALP
jgi:hypothetical protein